MRSRMKASLESMLQLVNGQTFDDPVFEGMVRDFASLHQALTSVSAGVDKFMGGIDAFCDGLVDLSEVVWEKW